MDPCRENTFLINIDKPSYSTNIPTQTNESISLSSKDPNCNELNTGDYSFQNNTKFDLSVSLISSPGKMSNRSYSFSATLQPGQRQSFFVGDQFDDSGAIINQITNAERTEYKLDVALFNF